MCIRDSARAARADPGLRVVAGAVSVRYWLELQSKTESQWVRDPIIGLGVTIYRTTPLPAAYLVAAPSAVWKSTSGMDASSKTSNLSISAKSKSIRLIFGRIDRSRRVLEAEPKSLCPPLRIRTH